MSNRDIIEFEARFIRDDINSVLFEYGDRKISIPRGCYYGKTQYGQISDNFKVKVPKWFAKQHRIKF